MLHLGQSQPFLFRGFAPWRGEAQENRRRRDPAMKNKEQVLRIG